MNFKTILPYGIAVILLVLLLLQKCNTDKARKISDSNINAYNDSLHTYKDKAGRQTAYTQIIEGNVSDLQKQIHNKDSSIAELAKLVNKKTTIAIIGGTETNIKGTTPTVVSNQPTVKVDSLDTCINHYPVYKTVWKDDWDSGHIIATHVNVSHNVWSRNEFDIKDSLISNGLFKPKTHVIAIKNKNPHTYTTKLKSFEVTEKSKNVLVWGIGGVVVGILVKVFLLK